MSGEVRQIDRGRFEAVMSLLGEHHYTHGETLAEIAAQFDVAASTARRCLHAQGVLLRPAARRRLIAS